MVQTENVRATLAAVDAGNADAAIVYVTDARMATSARVAFEIPDAEQPRIVYVARASRATRSSPELAAALPRLPRRGRGRRASCARPASVCPGPRPHRRERRCAARHARADAARGGGRDLAGAARRPSRSATLLARRRFRGRALVQALLALPMVLPPVAVGLGLLLAARTPRTVRTAAGTRSASRSSSAGGRPCWRRRVVGFPLFVRACEQAFAAVDPRYERVARSLGASPAARLRARARCRWRGAASSTARCSPSRAGSASSARPRSSRASCPAAPRRWRSASGRASSMGDDAGALRAVRGVLRAGARRDAGRRAVAAARAPPRRTQRARERRDARITRARRARRLHARRRAAPPTRASRCSSVRRGSGKTTLFETVLGLHAGARPTRPARPAAGSTTRSAGLALPLEARGLGWVPQEPHALPASRRRRQPALRPAPRRRRRRARARRRDRGARARPAARAPRRRALGRRARARRARARAGVGSAGAAARRAARLARPARCARACCRTCCASATGSTLPILYITHDPDEALLVGEWVAVLDRGRVVAVRRAARGAVEPRRAAALRGARPRERDRGARARRAPTAPRGSRRARACASRCRRRRRSRAGEPLRLGLPARDVLLAAERAGPHLRAQRDRRARRADRARGRRRARALDAGEPLVAQAHRARPCARSSSRPAAESSA